MSRFPPTPSPLSLPVCLFDISHSQTRSTFFTFRSIPLPWLGCLLISSARLLKELFFLSLFPSPPTTPRNNQQAYRLTSTQLKTTLHGRGLSPSHTLLQDSNQRANNPTNKSGCATSWSKCTQLATASTTSTQLTAVHHTVAPATLPNNEPSLLAMLAPFTRKDRDSMPPNTPTRTQDTAAAGQARAGGEVSCLRRPTSCQGPIRD